MIENPKTPGVYIDEINAFPNAVEEVATAIPAFIGYTPQAEYEGKSYHMKPVKVTSMQEFNAFFTFPENPQTKVTPKQYQPDYYIIKQKKAPDKGKYYTFNGDIYTIQPDPNTVYYLYNSIRLFFENGGGIAYIVSVGTYGANSHKGTKAGELTVNPNVKLSDLKTGLASLTKIPEVTMYIVPEATLLTQAENGTLMEEMLLQCGEMETAMSIFDIIGGEVPDPILWTKDIRSFRNSTGNNALKFGASYYPYLNTTITPIDEVDYTNINGGYISILENILRPSSNPNPQALSIIESIKAGNNLTVAQNNQALINASDTYKKIIEIIQGLINILPPSGAMAGIYTLVDSTSGVWTAPANKTPIGVTDVTMRINDSEQAGLNVDAVSGKSINAIRFFNGQGVLVWGARTLDGNSQDWRYISVRRTVTMIEQSIKLAIRGYVFAPNNAKTWGEVKSMLVSFLTKVWKEGALQGASAADAFSVCVGLGETMTAQDILNGYLRVSVKLAVIHPAEFIEISVEQQMAVSG